MINMLFGTPTFLAEYRSSIYGKSSVHFSENEYMPYITGNTYHPLVDQIRKLHKTVGNVEVMDTDEIVIGVGATQLLFAAFNVLYSKNVHVESPYWFRFSKILEMSGKNLRLDHDSKELLVLPNNPNNKLRIPAIDCPVIDACYMWPWYFRDINDYHTATKIHENVSPAVTIFSLAKCSGHAASRIGWAIVKDKEVAKQMRTFIEYSTGGASIEAQVRASTVLHFDKDSIKNMADRLEDRWKMLDGVVLKNIQFLNRKQGGMFLFGECLHPNFYNMLTQNGVLFMKGTDCGSHEGTFRASMGVDLETLEKFVEVLLKIDGEISNEA